MIGICTDSNAQLPPELIERYRVEVVPLTVTVDGHAFLEGVDLDADSFYARFETGAPTVTTAAPSPGQFVQAYAALVAAGADEILSIHIGANTSGTINAARLAASAADVPVRLVDSGTASFGIGCCVWEAGEAIAAGADLDRAAAVAESVAATVGNVFIVRALELARAGGRIDPSLGAAADATDAVDAVPVLTFIGGAMRAIGEARDLDQAAELMAGHVRAHGDRLRVAIGVADAAAAPAWRALEDRLRDAPEVTELVRYRVGPSAGVHTGPGTAGAFFYPSRSPRPPVL